MLSSLLRPNIYQWMEVARWNTSAIVLHVSVYFSPSEVFNWICVYFRIQMRSVVSSVSKVHSGFLSSWFWNACIWVGEMHLFTRGDLQSDSRWLGSCFGIQFPIEPGLAKDLFKFACSCFVCVSCCVIGRWFEIGCFVVLYDGSIVVGLRFLWAPWNKPYNGNEIFKPDIPLGVDDWWCCPCVCFSCPFTTWMKSPVVDGSDLTHLLQAWCP